MKRFKKILVSMLIFSLFIPNLTFATETNTKANLSQLRMTDKGIEIALDGFTDSSYENGYYSYVIYDDNGGTSGQKSLRRYGRRATWLNSISC